ncbi:MAG: PmoA family protein, partial [Pirellulaceae bacterium]|nr:PmoA family protein [Pirellulaceae bacterium]
MCLEVVNDRRPRDVPRSLFVAWLSRAEFFGALCARLWRAKQQIHSDTCAAVTMLLGLAFVASTIAGETGEVVEGKTLAIVRDDAAVTVKQGDRVVVRYRYAGRTSRPHMSTATSPGGRPALAELAFDWRVDGADFSGETDKSGRQVHQAWETLRIDTAGGTERAVLQERLRWESADGDYLLEEHRTLTVPAPSPGRAQMLVWQATFTPAEDAVDTLTLDGGPQHGLIARLAGRAGDDSYFNSVGSTGVAQTNG